uniref:Uncharacterized protein n=1 Tax=Anguilla anguilla TaxID=7936 RepID=A0A0E9T3S1_ANGAN
MEYTHSLGIL